MTTATELRKAAETLRGRAGAASPAPWRTFDQHGRDYADLRPTLIGVANDWHDVALTYPAGVDDEDDGPDAAYIATMHPGVGLALADVLDLLASHGEAGLAIDLPALALARLINGGAQ